MLIQVAKGYWTAAPSAARCWQAAGVGSPRRAPGVGPRRATN